MRVRFALNLLRLGAKDWWKFVTIEFSPMEKAAVTWEWFVEMFHEGYVPLMERERLAQEYLLLRQTTKTVTEITRMFHDSSMFCLEYASTKQERMTRYLSMLKKDIREFVTNSQYRTLVGLQYRTLVGLQSNARRREIELKLQVRETELDTHMRDRRPIQSQQAAKQVNPTDSR